MDNGVIVPGLQKEKSALHYNAIDAPKTNTNRRFDTTDFKAAEKVQAPDKNVLICKLWDGPCYANHNADVRKRNFEAYNSNSPLLCSQVTELDKITERKVKSQRNMHFSLFNI